MTDDPYASVTPAPSFDVRSDDFTHGGELPVELRDPDIGGKQTSPQLSWSGFPEGTRSFAITCYDPDAPTGIGFMHWAVANIPATVTSLPAGAGAPGSPDLPDGVLTLPNDVRLSQYVGPNPPPASGRHRYVFVVHAVDVPVLEIDPGLTPTVLGFNLHFHTLARGHVTGWVDSVEAGHE
ncbi:YbhB/YbcL family Raf kinase inhibitor-like protein [Actinoplanes sp. LDG1-06]|uniref:YbhB/YbcL family Raf kinase inhibitor-like protein n=1 Tax=Paractinoplanes ovalisporus TaxID=2810368 RepID=A0ABS2AHR3_9ACTN|nr:YbhB/YbcL family Raf kinase inhibitor-like protein [Actinoplanes ovalisporus]MBM2619381.1 YbhB/YbcL family Raf kinase inhibitor-like protein [Actinoplanes ovalisporus]